MLAIIGKEQRAQSKEPGPVSETEQKSRIDKKIYILRPCMIYGPGNKGNLNLLYKLVSKGIPLPLGAFENSHSVT